MELKFTVVTVVFNGAAVIGKTMRSVLTQTVSPYEYLIFDGGSTDGTWETVTAMAEEFAAAGIAFHAVREKDTGIYNAMNKGIRVAEGDFISFLNAGDWYEPDALANIAAFYAEAPFDLTYGGLHYIQSDGSVRDKMSRLDRFPVSSRNWNHPSMFLRREIYQKYYFNEEFRAYADFDLYLKLRKDGTRIRVIDKVITNFVADGVSTATGLKKVLARAGEKYRAYRHNGYSPVYWAEAYGWELLKACYMKLHSGQ
ncbi:MAG: glycosyltransferase [Clostridia bacterium]|nr:glycosyltransferase [Clostridia bacterium]